MKERIIEILNEPLTFGTLFKYSLYFSGVIIAFVAMYLIIDNTPQIYNLIKKKLNK